LNYPNLQYLDSFDHNFHQDALKDSFHWEVLHSTLEENLIMAIPPSNILNIPISKGIFVGGFLYESPPLGEKMV